MIPTREMCSVAAKYDNYYHRSILIQVELEHKIRLNIKRQK